MDLPPITFSVDIAAPREEVFAYFADPRHRADWQSSLKRVEMLDRGEPRVGIRWKDHTKVGVVAELETTVQEQPERWAETGSWRGVRADLSMIFESLADGGTRAHVEAVIAGEKTYVVLALAAWPAMPVALRMDVRHAGRIIEGRSG
ncbi:SRPBCC family protein [Nocardioidaceae bacterium]|nr:SRPBCC family protein [Nocardioidaceae bacterium]